MSPELIVKLGVNETGMQAGMRRASGVMQRFGDELRGRISAVFDVGRLFDLGVRIGRSIISGVGRAFRDAKDIENSAKGLGLGVEEFQTLKNAAEESGTSIETIGRFIKGLANASDEIRNGTDSALKYKVALTALGLTLQEIASLDSKGMFRAIGERIGPSAKAGTITDEQRAALSDVGVRNPSEMIQFFARGVQEIDSYLIKQNEMVKKLSDAEDGFNRLGRVSKLIFTEMGAQIAPVVKRFDKLAAGAGEEQTRGFVKNSVRALMGFPWMFAGAISDIRQMDKKPQQTQPNIEMLGPPNLTPEQRKSWEENKELRELLKKSERQKVEKDAQALTDYGGSEDVTFNPDQLMRSGGFVGAAMGFSPMLDISRMQLQTQQQLLMVAERQLAALTDNGGGDIYA